MLKLYNKEHVAIGALTNLKDYKIEYVLSGEDSLEFPLSISDENIHLVEEEGYVRTKNNEYVIKAIDSSDDSKRFTAIVNVEDLAGKSIAKFDTSNNSITDTIRLAIAGTGWVLADNNITRRRTVRLTNTNALEVLRKIRKVFRVDFRYDAINKVIHTYEQFGEDRGVYFSDELNLKSFSIPSDTYDYATRLYCYGKDGLNISSINGGKEYIENFQYSNKIIETIWEDNRYTDVNNLKEDAEAKLDELSKPKRSYQAEVSDLAKQSKEYEFLDFFLGDTITLLSKQEKFRDKQRIVKYIEYPNEPYNNTCELGNTTLTFEELQAENEAKNNIVDNITSDNGTVDGSKVDGISTEQIYDFEASVGKIVDFTSVNADIANLKAENVTITGKLTSIESEFGTLKANVGVIDKLTVTHTAQINDLKANRATITQLNAVSATIGTVEADVGKINTLLAGNLTGQNIQAGGITSDKLTIANGFITNAMIANLDVAKINAGNISTNKFKIKSDDGGIEIVGATQQFKDKNNKVRIQMGQDIQGNFNFIIRGEDGTTTLIDHTGIKEKAIADDLIKNNMIAQDAIGEKQINYSSFITGFNKDTNANTIKSTKIMLNNQNQTLDVAFSQLKTQADGTKSLTESHSTTIGVMQGQISTAINNTQIVKDGQTILLKDDYNRTVQTIDSMQSTIGSHTTQISGLNSTVNTQGSSISQLKNQIALKVEQSDITTAINNIEVSSRNLIMGSKSEYTNISIGKYNGTVAGRWGRIHCSEYGLNAGDTITFSVKIKAINKSKLRARIDFYSEANGDVGKTTYTSKELVEKGKEGISSLTVTIPEGKEYITLYVSNVDTVNDITTTTEQYMNDILTKGNKVVGWSPAPEDVQSSIDTKANSNDVYLKTEVYTKTQTDSAINIAKNEINLSVSSTYETKTNVTTKFNNAVTTSRSILDTRNTNENPQWYMTNYPRQTITEFKYTSVVGLTNVGTYGTVTTVVPWDNSSGGLPVQTFRNNSTGATYERRATSTTTWGNWYQVEDTQGSQNKANSALNDAKSYTNGQITTVNQTITSKVAEIKATTDAITQRVSSTETTLLTTTSTANSALSQANANKSSISSLTTRVSTAESKLSKDSLTTIIGSYYTTSTDVNGIVTSKGYQTSSQVQQTVDKLEIKFTQSGGENKVLNGQFKNKLDNWSTNLQVQVTFNNPYQLYEGTGIQVNCKEANAGIYQVIDTIPGETYSFSMMVNSEINMKVGFEDANCVVYPEANYTWLRYTGTFTATKKQHAIVAYSYHYTGIFYISNVCVTRGSIPPQYTPSAYEIYDGITTINKNGIEIDSTNANTKNIINHDGFSIIDKSTLDYLLKATSQGIIAKGGKFVVEDKVNGNTVLWGRDVVINGQRALVGVGNTTSDGLITKKLYINYSNDFTNGVEIGGTLTNNGRNVLSLINQNLYKEGYMRLSNGFLLQWGHVTGIGISNGVVDVAITYPIRFPNKCLVFIPVVDVVDNDNYLATQFSCIGRIAGNSSGWFYARNLLDNRGGSMTINYIAIGY